MDLTFIHVRKPQEVFEKGSKRTGRRRGLPAPLYPALLEQTTQGALSRRYQSAESSTTGHRDSLQITNSEEPDYGKADHLSNP
jgi:hypothetical protein